MSDYNQIEDEDDLRHADAYKSSNIDAGEFQSAKRLADAVDRYKLAQRYEERAHAMDEADKMGGI